MDRGGVSSEWTSAGRSRGSRHRRYRGHHRGGRGELRRPGRGATRCRSASADADRHGSRQRSRITDAGIVIARVGQPVAGAIRELGRRLCDRHAAAVAPLGLLLGHGGERCRSRDERRVRAGARARGDSRSAMLLGRSRSRRPRRSGARSPSPSAFSARTSCARRGSRPRPSHTRRAPRRPSPTCSPMGPLNAIWQSSPPSSSRPALPRASPRAAPRPRTMRSSSRSSERRSRGGSRVTVRPRPLATYLYGGRETLLVQSTWREPGQADREIDLMLSPDGARWYWRGTLLVGRRS